MPFLEFCLRNKKVILIATAVCFVLSLGYALTASRQWLASQTMVLRDDLLGQSFKPGRFPSQENLKNAQETLLHIAKKAEVIRAALRATYTERAADEIWPSNSTIDATRDLITLLAPNGSEFGKTDVVLLNVKQSRPENAQRFARELAQQIEKHIRIFRSDLLRSMEQELHLQYEQSKKEFQQVAEPVRELIEITGTDLESLKSFKDFSSAPNELQRILEGLKAETRKGQSQVQLLERQLELLQEARSQPEVAFARNNELMQTQPSLKRLVDGLNESKVLLSQISGALLPEHPRRKAAEQAVISHQQQIASEIGLIEAALRTQLELAQRQIRFFESEEAAYASRMLRLNQKRIDFHQLTSDLTQRLDAMGKLQTNLSEIQSLANTADRVSLVAIVGEPELTTKPLGMSRSWLIIFGTLGGWLLGLGLAFTLNDPTFGPAVQAQLSRFENHIRSSRLKRRGTTSPPANAPATRPFGSGAVRPLKRPSEIVRHESSAEQTPTQPTRSDVNDVDTNWRERSDHTQEPLLPQGVSERLPVSSKSAEEAIPANSETSPDQVSEQDFEREHPQDGAGSIPEEQAALEPLSSTVYATAPTLKSDKTLDLSQLQQALHAEAPAEQASDTPLAAIADTAQRQRHITERLDRLSQAISAYCNPVPKNSLRGDA